MKKNIVLESYNKLFLEQPTFDHKRISKEYIEKLVNDMLNDEGNVKVQNGEIIIGNLNFLPSDIVKKLDPDAYNMIFNDYCDAQKIEMNDDGTYYDHMDEELNNQSDLAKECCHCCGHEFLKQELDPQNGYCIDCQQDELLNGPKEFRVLPDDTEQIIIIKQSCMKRWKKLQNKK